jgi:Arc/MetJ family transcription regulator
LLIELSVDHSIHIVQMCMRTNIVLDDELIREAGRYSKARTKRALVEEALRTLVGVRAEEQRRATYRDRLGALERKLAGIVLPDSPAELLRQDRESR